MRLRKAFGGLLGATVLVGSIMTPQALAAPNAVPVWSVQALAVPTNFAPGEESGRDLYEAQFTNNGAAATDGSPITVTDTLPKGLGVKGIKFESSRRQLVELSASACKTQTAAEVSTVTCTLDEGAPLGVVEPARVYGDESLRLEVRVTVPPTASDLLVNQVSVEGGGAEAASDGIENPLSEEDANAGYEEFHATVTGADGTPVTGAGSHPYQYATSFAVNTALAPNGDFFLPADGDIKQIEVVLPPGLVGNPSVIPHCTAQQFNTVRGKTTSGGLNYGQNECPDASAVGLVNVQQLEGLGGVSAGVPLYNLVPPKGMPAQFGFQPIFGLPFYINTKVRSDGNYGVTPYLADVSEVKRISAARTVIWGVPADSRHDRLRGGCAYTKLSCPANLPKVKPFFRLPTSCESPMTNTMRFTTWTEPAVFLDSSATEAAPVDCDLPDFSPTLEAKPTTSVADSASGLHIDLHLPQAENEDPNGLSEADLKDTTVTLPAGLSVNPSSADGLAACSLAQIGYTGQSEGHSSFTAEPANCPDASKIGTVEIDAPAIEHPLPGAVYLAKQGENPFDSLLAIYITVNDPQAGVVVKLAGKVTPDPVTGQLTTAVVGSPQVPFEDFKLDFFEGARAPLRTPAVCGTHAMTTSLTPWTAPASGPNATPSDSFETTTAPDGGACPTSTAELPFNPRFEAGSQSPIAGAYSPFVVNLSRQDGSQELKGLNLTLPAGMAARFAGVAECSDASIASAEGKSGRQEQAASSCSASSHLGTVTVGVGAGPAPYYVKGDTYLAGPYQGAPLSLAIITPAVAGPFDLGTVVVRAPLLIDPETAQGRVKSSFPTILQGIPLDVRSIQVAIDRKDFTLNPTSCEAKEVKAEAISAQGQSVFRDNRFQVGACANLGFKPKLSLKLTGGTKRGAHPAFTATLTYPKVGAYSNIAFAQVALPHSEFLDQAHIGTVCTRVQFAANQCPAKSVYGYARAITPLLDKPLEGPVYLRSSSHQLPDLVAALNGQVNVVLAGRNDSVNGGLRNTFEAVPDAPVTKFTLKLKGAKKGLLQNSTDICEGTHKANARFVAHNGKIVVLKPELQAQCGGRSAAEKHGKQGR